MLSILCKCNTYKNSDFSTQYLGWSPKPSSLSSQGQCSSPDYHHAALQSSVGFLDVCLVLLGAKLHHCLWSEERKSSPGSHPSCNITPLSRNLTEQEILLCDYRAGLISWGRIEKYTSVSKYAMLSLQRRQTGQSVLACSKNLLWRRTPALASCSLDSKS